MSVPGIIEDGDFSILLQNGAWTPSFPFANVGDEKTFIMRAKFRVNLNNWTPPIAMSQLVFSTYGTAYFVDIENTDSINGSELVDYTLVYASIPNRRVEYGSASATIQKSVVNADTSISLVAYTDTFDGQYVYEYSANAPLQQLYRGRLVRPTNTLSANPIQQAGPWHNAAQGGNSQLAQNSTSRIWKGKIYERLSVFVTPPEIVATGAILA